MWGIIFKIQVIFGFRFERQKTEKLIKKQTYTKTEAYKLYSRVFWIFLSNVIKIDPYNFWAILFQSWCIFWDIVEITHQENENALCFYNNAQ